jgi:amidase
MSLAAETDNLVYGRTNNPYDLKRTSGGSSGGEAAIIAAGGSPMGLGSDMGGSIRIPAHFCGIAGLKPTSGRVPQSPFPPDGLWDVLWQFGPMARCVEDLVLTLPIIAGVDWRDPTMVPMPLGNAGEVKLGSLCAAFYTDNGIVSPTRETVRVIEKTVESLSDAGLKVEETRPEGVEQSYDIIIGLFGADGGAGIRRQLQDLGTTEISPLLQRFLDLSRAYKATTVSGFLDLMRKRAMFKSSVFSFMEKYDIIICPVCAWPAPPHGFSFDDEGIKAAVSYTCAYNLTGMPGSVVRGGTSPEGLPIGVQIVSRPWREDVALAVARHIERTLGGWQPPPI